MTDSTPRAGGTHKALTLWQPWASLVALGVKTIETRSWSTAYRGPLAIHAAARRPPTYWHHNVNADLPPAYDLCAMASCWEWSENPDDFASGGCYRWAGPLGAVLATCTLVDVVPILAGDRAERIDWADLPYPRIESRSDNGPDFPDGWLDLWHPTMGSAVDPENDGRAIPDQATYGDYAPGRFAWLLDGITPLPEPIPAKGGQRIWNWRREAPA